MGYKSTLSSRAVRACGHDYYFSKIAFILQRFQQGKSLTPRLKRRYAPWLEWLSQPGQTDRTALLGFILDNIQDCPAVLLSIDIWPELLDAWACFRPNNKGADALMAELRMYNWLFPRATLACWRRHLRVLAGEEHQDQVRFFADLLLERSNRESLAGTAWNEAALHLLTGGRTGKDKHAAMQEMLRFFTQINGRSRVDGIRLYHGCCALIPALKENSPIEHWFFSALMALFAESAYAERLCGKLNRPVSAFAGQAWWYLYFQLWMGGEFPVFARLLLPRQALGLFRPFGRIQGDIIIRNLPLFMLKKLPELMRDNHDKKLVVHLAAGNNIRTARNLPFPMSKKMAHCFANLSDAADCRDAFWWAFGQACGASAQVVRYFRRYWRLTEIKQHYAFLESALRFVQQAGYEAARLDAVTGYLRHAVHESLGRYSLQGRTPESVLRQAEAFYAQIQIGFQYGKPMFWSANPVIKPFVYETEQGHYTVIELTSSFDLQEEGRTLKHCVGSYSWECKLGRSSIWSLRFSDGITKTVLVTIQLDAHHHIVQAKGMCNRLPLPAEMAVIQQWATAEGIRVERC